MVAAEQLRPLGDRLPSSSTILALTLAVAMWGTAPVANRFLVGSGMQQITPGALLAVRFGLSALLVLPLALRARIDRWDRRDQLLLLASTLIGVVGYNLPVTLGQVTVPASTTALVIATEPIWIILLWALRERRWPRYSAVLGALTGLAGIALVETAELDRLAVESVAGLALVLMGAFCFAAYCVLTAELVRRRGALSVTAATLVIGSIPFLLANGWSIPAAVQGLDTGGLAALALLAIGSNVVATMLWNHGISVLPGPRSGVFLYAMPIIGVLASHVVLGEPLSWRVLVAVACVLTGVVVAQLGGRKAAS